MKMLPTFSQTCYGKSIRKYGKDTKNLNSRTFLWHFWKLKRKKRNPFRENNRNLKWTATTNFFWLANDFIQFSLKNPGKKEKKSFTVKLIKTLGSKK